MTGSDLSHLAHLSKLISVEEYLNTSYRPDVEYVDGEIQERNLGEFDHGDLQLALGTLFRIREQAWSIRAVVETRVQVAPTRFRVPDVCVLAAGLTREQIASLPMRSPLGIWGSVLGFILAAIAIAHNFLSSRINEIGGIVFFAGLTFAYFFIKRRRSQS